MNRLEERQGPRDAHSAGSQRLKSPAPQVEHSSHAPWEEEEEDAEDADDAEEREEEDLEDEDEDEELEELLEEELLEEEDFEEEDLEETEEVLEEEGPLEEEDREELEEVEEALDDVGQFAGGLTVMVTGRHCGGGSGKFHWPGVPWQGGKLGLGSQ